MSSGEPRAYYNEHDPHAVVVLRQLIADNLIAPGDVDDRSIEDVTPNDVRGYTQCHFFAGFGIWSLAFRFAGWPDSRSVWSGSCPCQPFSAAGKGLGFDDERHLWPAWFHLITHGKRPDVPVYGEQVAGSRVMPWIDLVWNDLEATGHRFRPVILASAGFGAPIIRQRTFWVASSPATGHERRRTSETSDGRDEAREQSERFCDAGGMGSANGTGSFKGEQRGSPTGHWNPAFSASSDGRMVGTNNSLRRSDLAGGNDGYGPETKWDESDGESGASINVGGLGESSPPGLPQQRSLGRTSSEEIDGVSRETLERTGSSDASRPGPTNGWWRLADWLRCRDDKWRPVEPGTFPLAHGYPSRVPLLRLAGNAISPVVAAEFIKASQVWD